MYNRHNRFYFAVILVLAVGWSHSLKSKNIEIKMIQTEIKLSKLRRLTSAISLYNKRV